MIPFGTDGIRAQVGTGILTPQALLNIGFGIGAWVQSKGISTVYIGQDTRNSSDLLSTALTTGLLCHPLSVVSLGVIPTPVLEYTTHSAEEAIGVMVTASHNPYHDNGIKILLHEGKLTEEDERELTFFFEQPQTINYEALGTLLYKTDAFAQYKKWLHTRFEKKLLADVTLALDCANGALSNYAQDCLTSFGAHVIVHSCLPDGKNINKECGALHPEDIKKGVKKYKAHLGCAFDGDGDRLTLIAPDGRILDGDDTLALLLQHPDYRSQTTVVGTIMSNQGLAHHVEMTGRTFVRTPVGDKFVSRALREKEALLGGEPSGHTIIRDFSETSDGLLTALRVLESIVLNKNWKVTTFTKFPQVSINLPIKQKQNLQEEPYAPIIKEYQDKLRSGRVVVRYSGTEPLLRIMVEDEDAHYAEHIGLELSRTLAFHLG